MATKKLSANLQPFCANDPFGNFVTIPKSVKDIEGNPFSMEGLYEEAMDTITDPLLILEMGEEEVRFFYYRIYGNTSILLGVKHFEDHYLASHCQKNPGQEQLSVLYKKAKFIH